MYVVIVDIVALIVFVAGVVLLVKSVRPADGGSGGDAATDAGTYGRRICGTMMAAFGLAIGMMVTLFHFASGS
jgi:hypothetical protein